jgi:hypothetical protein
MEEIVAKIVAEIYIIKCKFNTKRNLTPLLRRVPIAYGRVEAKLVNVQYTTLNIHCPGREPSVHFPACCN